MKTSTDEFEKAAAKRDHAKYVLRLYVTGMSPKSANAIANVRKLCEKHLAGRYRLDVVDICRQPDLAREDQIIATPTLIRKLPMPLRKIIGKIYDAETFIAGIDLKFVNS